MNEAQIRERLQEAVGDWRYPAGFSNRLEARLRHLTPDQDVRTGTGRRHIPWLVSLGRTGSVVGILLILLLMASLLLGVHLWLVNTQPVVPAGPGLSVKDYQSMISVDLRGFVDAPNYTCTALDDPNCLPEVAYTTDALQQWLNDLDGSQPPGRFAALDGLMRRDLARAILDQNAFVNAYRAKDPKWATIGFDVSLSVSVAQDIIASSQATGVQYTAEVRLDRTYLLACALCQRLVSQGQVSCPTGQTPSCLDEIAAVRLQVEIFLEDLVRLFAPDDMASKDARLQADLVTADQQLDAMSAALSAGDQVALQGSHDAFRTALNRVESDAADISGS
jgi:hypothetical protein